MIKRRKIVERMIRTHEVKIVNGDVADITRELKSPSIHRMGLEITEHLSVKKNNGYLIGWGSKESKYFETLDAKEVERILNVLFDESTPMIILSSGVSENIQKLIIKVANVYKVPVVTSRLHLAQVYAILGVELVKEFADEESVHGSLVEIDGVGVMIIGESGVGKSEALLELIQAGQTFITDDTVVLKRIGSNVYGTYNEITKGLLEARGIGLINIPHIYGERSTKKETIVELVVELIPAAKIENVDRLGINQLTYKVLGGQISKIQIPVDSGRDIAALIEAATNVFIARREGHDPIEEMKQRRDGIK